MPNWTEIGTVNDIPRLGSRIVRTSGGDVAVFRTARDEVFALFDRCPHKGGPLSQGIVHDKTVTCPLHNWKIELASGNAVAPDEGCTNRFDVEVRDGVVFLDLRELTASSEVA